MKQVVEILYSAYIRADGEGNSDAAGEDVVSGVRRLYRHSTEKEHMVRILKLAPWKGIMKKADKTHSTGMFQPTQFPQAPQSQQYPNQWTPTTPRWPTHFINQEQRGRSNCEVCGKWGHSEPTCWTAHPELRKS